ATVIASVALGKEFPNWSSTSAWTAGVMADPTTVLVGWVLNPSAEAVPGPTVTLVAWVIATPLIVAETVFVSATVELKVPDATPLAFAGAAGWVKLFPLPVAASVTVTPLTGFPLAFLAVT